MFELSPRIGFHMYTNSSISFDVVLSHRENDGKNIFSSSRYVHHPRFWHVHWQNLFLLPDFVLKLFIFPFALRSLHDPFLLLSWSVLSSCHIFHCRHSRGKQKYKMIGKKTNNNKYYALKILDHTPTDT